MHVPELHALLSTECVDVLNADGCAHSQFVIDGYAKVCTVLPSGVCAHASSRMTH